MSSSAVAFARESEIENLESSPVRPAAARSAAQRYFFFHVPKTGGRTVETHLIERFGEPNVFHPRRRKGWLTDLVRGAKFVADPSAVAHAGRHVSGQFAPLSLLAGREAEFHKACFWRHPADWFLSFYNYRHYRQADRLRRGFGFGDFRKSMLRNPMTEHLLLYCGAVPGWVYFVMSERQRFAAACALIERFDTFADISKVDDFLYGVGYRDGRPPKDHNRIPARRRVLAVLDAPVRAAIERENRIDTYLHRLSLGEDRAAICAEADATLRARFDLRDLARLAAVPYYRFKIWVLPFLPSWKPEEQEAEAGRGGFLWVPVRTPKR